MRGSKAWNRDMEKGRSNRKGKQEEVERKGKYACWGRWKRGVGSDTMVEGYIEVRWEERSHDGESRGGGRTHVVKGWRERENTFWHVT